MSNEYKDWLYNRFSEVLLENGKIDKPLSTHIIDGMSWCAVVDGLKDGCRVRYNVWFDEDDGYWCYERSEE